MNPIYDKQVKEEINWLPRVGFIYLVEKATWISPIVIVFKKNMKIRLYVDYKRLNVATIPDPFPLLFMNSSLDEVAGKETTKKNFHQRMGGVCSHGDGVWTKKHTNHLSKDGARNLLQLFDWLQESFCGQFQCSRGQG